MKKVFLDSFILFGLFVSSITSLPFDQKGKDNGSHILNWGMSASSPAAQFYKPEAISKEQKVHNKNADEMPDMQNPGSRFIN